MSLSDNLMHLVAAIAILATGVALVIFGHAYVDSSYVLTTCFTLVGAILGYKFGMGASVPTTPAVIQLPAPPAPPPAHPLELEAVPPITNVMLPAVTDIPRPAAG